MFRLVLCAFFLVGFGSLAVASFEDPQNLLAQVDDFITQTSFAEAFPCGQVVVYQKNYDICEGECSGTFCNMICWGENAPAERFIAGCEADRVQVYWHNGKMDEVSAAAFASWNQNMVRPFLASLSDWITYPMEGILVAVEPTTFTLDRETPEERKIDALHLKGEMRLEVPGGSYNAPFLITVAKSLPGVAQILRFRFDEGTWFYTLSVGQ